MEGGSILTDLKGSISLSSADESYLRGSADQGIELCSIGSNCHEVEAEHVIVPVGERAGPSIAKAAASFSIFEPHRLTWTTQQSLFGVPRGVAVASFPSRVAVALLAVGRPRSGSDYSRRSRNSLVILDRISSGKFVSTSAKMGVRNAVLVHRQLYSEWRAERFFLFLGRCLGLACDW